METIEQKVEELSKSNRKLSKKLSEFMHFWEEKTSGVSVISNTHLYYCYRSDSYFFLKTGESELMSTDGYEVGKRDQSMTPFWDYLPKKKLREIISNIPKCIEEISKKIDIIDEKNSHLINEMEKLLSAF